LIWVVVTELVANRSVVLIWVVVTELMANRVVVLIELITFNVPFISKPFDSIEIYPTPVL
jgi:hypothetical protein